MKDIRKGDGCYNNLLEELIQSYIPGYQDLVLVPPAVFVITKEHIRQWLKNKATLQAAFRSGLKAGHNTKT